MHWTDRARATLTAQGSGGAVLGLRTSYYVGWTAEQAGQALAIVRISGAMLGVVVPDIAAGPVEVAYRLPAASLPCLLLGIGVLAALAFAAPGRTRRATKSGSKERSAPAGS